MGNDWQRRDEADRDSMRAPNAGGLMRPIPASSLHNRQAANPPRRPQVDPRWAGYTPNEPDGPYTGSVGYAAPRVQTAQGSAMQPTAQPTGAHAYQQPMRRQTLQGAPTASSMQAAAKPPRSRIDRNAQTQIQHEAQRQPAPTYRNPIEEMERNVGAQPNQTRMAAPAPRLTRQRQVLQPTASVASARPRQEAYPVPASEPIRKPDDEFAMPVDDEWADDDQQDAMPTEQMASPVTVPTMEGFSTASRGKGWLIGGVVGIVLIAVAVVLWATGTWGRRTAAPVEDQAPAIFAAVTQTDTNGMTVAPTTSLAPALASDAPKLTGFTAQPAEASVPAVITFTVNTTGTTTAVRLLDEQGVLLSTQSESVPEGDGVRWIFQASFQSPYQGKIYAYLRDGDNTWMAGDTACTIVLR